jgi:hypothetical protein
MSSKRIQQNKEKMRRIVKRVDRTEDAKEGDLKGALDASVISKARSKSLSVASNKVLREEASSKKPAPGFSEFFRNKHEDSPKLACLPREQAAARTFATTKLKAKPQPTAYWQSLQQ